MDIHQELTSVFREIFVDPGLELTDSTTAEDIEMWDSTMHIILIFAIEDRFGFQFTSNELETLSDVGAIKSVITQRSDV